MPQTTVLTDSSYKKLLTDLRTILEEGKARAQKAAAQELIETTWALGKRITEEKLTENANYGDSILEDLAEDLGMDESHLRRSVLFYETYKIHAPRGVNLTWSHYRELLNLPNEEIRDWYEKETQKEGWTRDQLLSAIRRDAFDVGGGKRKSELKLKRPAEATYVYKSAVERIIDGDTLILRIDLGFQVWKEQRIRLAQIDSPPIDEKKGYEAFEFVRDQLARAPFVLVRTHKIEVHGRYVGDVFYS
ncbi:MAG: hypothetical protein HY583_04125, partial [Candidatus Omnitrophica bacterium]|nr:hypothetical protein [Candidatus Omnitrophota bacterium]